MPLHAYLFWVSIRLVAIEQVSPRQRPHLKGSGHCCLCLHSAVRGFALMDVGNVVVRSGVSFYKHLSSDLGF